MNQSGFPVMPIDPAAEKKQAEPQFKRGDRVRVSKRSPAFDPASREYVTIFAHTPATVVFERDARQVLRDHITVMLQSADNGFGRIVQILTADLEKPN